MTIFILTEAHCNDAVQRYLALSKNVSKFKESLIALEIPSENMGDFCTPLTQEYTKKPLMIILDLDQKGVINF